MKTIPKIEDDKPPRIKRSRKEIQEACHEFQDKVWWNRHQIREEKIADGRMKLDKCMMDGRIAAKRIEAKYGRENLGWDDFEWGMLNGKLSALRWLWGEEWDWLDT